MKTLALFLAVFLVPAAFADEALERRLENLSVPFYYDLGPDSIDVSQYPKRRRKQYEIFVRRCSECHTLARAVNSPMRTRPEWKYYVNRMHLYGLGGPREKEIRVEYDDIVDFLAYDSRLRRIKRGDEFIENDRRLREKFRAIHEERIRLLRRMLETGSPSQGK